MLSLQRMAMREMQGRPKAVRVQKLGAATDAHKADERPCLPYVHEPTNNKGMQSMRKKPPEGNIPGVEGPQLQYHAIHLHRLSTPSLP